MRVPQVVSSLFSTQEFINKVNYLSQLKGGWERWFQMELVWHIAANYSSTYQIAVEDSTVYPGTALRADMTIHCPYLSGTTTVVELKCQVAGGNIDTFIGLVKEDIAKRTGLKGCNDYHVIALVQTQKELERVRQALAATYPGMITPYYFSPLLVAPSGFISFYCSFCKEAK